MFVKLLKLEDPKVDFMAKHRLFFAISAGFVLLSLGLLAVKGLNLGIDFKGGTKVIVAFKKEINRDKLRDQIAGLVQKESGDKGTKQVEVQDFSKSSELVRYAIQTEISTFLTEKGKQRIAAALVKHFGKGTAVDIPTESGGRFDVYVGKAFLNWKKDKNTITGKSIPEIKAEIAKVLRKTGFSTFEIKSGIERNRYYQQLQEKSLISVETELKGEWFLAWADVVESAVADAIKEKTVKPRPLLKKGEVDTQYVVEIKEIAAKVGSVLTKEYGANFVGVDSASTISASVGANLFYDGLLAILYALLGILAYIAIRFEWKFSPGAVIALLHDVLITMGVFSLLSVKFTLPIIAALLTIVGYSLNDTIVVYDRIRENLGRLRGKKLVDVVNMSINETLSRTLLTSITTMVVVVAILIWGGGQIQDFALALCIGIVVGTYSSIFIASPVTLYMERYLEDRAKSGAVKASAPAK